VPLQLLYDGTDSAAVSTLSRIRHVTLQFMAPPFASEADQQEFAAWEQQHWQWGNKPGNFRLMVKQGRHMHEPVTCTFRMQCCGPLVC
jgi:hypothetical protein